LSLLIGQAQGLSGGFGSMDIGGVENQV